MTEQESTHTPYAIYIYIYIYATVPAGKSYILAIVDLHIILVSDVQHSDSIFLYIILYLKLL